MYALPTSVTIADREFKIRNNGDYRVVLDCFDALEDTELDETTRMMVALIIFYEDFNSISDVSEFEDIETAIDEMCQFFNCGQKESPGAKVKHKLIDWNQDSPLIFAAINQVANTEVRSLEYMHWWTFMGHYISIGKSVLSEVVGIRNKIVSGKKLEKYERDFKNQNPQYFVWNSQTAEQRDNDAWLRSVWNSK